MLILDTEKNFINNKIENKNSKSKKIIFSPKKILVMGLPGSGKTFLSKELNKIVPIIHLNADEIRKHFDDWDFSKEGRLRQADRMKRFSDYIFSVIAEEYGLVGCLMLLTIFFIPTKSLIT